MKKLLSVLLACIMLLACLPLAAFAEETNSWDTLNAEIAAVEPGSLTDEQAEEIKNSGLIPNLYSRYYEFYEVEPNDYFSDADWIGNEYTVAGSLDYEDVDSFRFVLTETSRVIIASASDLNTFAFGIFTPDEECIAVGAPMGYEEGFFICALDAIFPAGTYYVCALDMERNDNFYAFAIGWEAAGSVPMYRMYDPNSGEHFYTGSTDERDFLVNAGWHYEGVGFNFPLEGKPVYRLYEPVYGEHLYTMDEAEKAKLMSWGWSFEGVAFNSAGEDEVPQYRLRNPNSKRGGYHFTGSTKERQDLINAGWIYEGIGWYSCLE